MYFLNLQLCTYNTEYLPTYWAWASSRPTLSLTFQTHYGRHYGRPTSKLNKLLGRTIVPLSLSTGNLLLSKHSSSFALNIMCCSVVLYVTCFMLLSFDSPNSNVSNAKSDVRRDNPNICTVNINFGSKTASYSGFRSFRIALSKD